MLLVWNSLSEFILEIFSLEFRKEIGSRFTFKAIVPKLLFSCHDNENKEYGGHVRGVKDIVRSMRADEHYKTRGY